MSITLNNKSLYGGWGWGASYAVQITLCEELLKRQESEMTGRAREEEEEEEEGGSHTPQVLAAAA